MQRYTILKDCRVIFFRSIKPLCCPRIASNGQIVHNIGGGQRMEDCLFHWKIIGHYLYGTIENKSWSKT